MSEQEPSRLIAMGSPALADGFSLIGFETYPGADADALEQLLGQLLASQQRALIVLEDYLARSRGALLRRVRNEGGHLVIVEVPPLHAPNDYHPQVEELMVRLLGSSALERSVAES